MFENYTIGDSSVLELIGAGVFHLATIIGVLLTLILVSQILRNNRRPSATIGWLLLILLIPIIGIPLYLLFGERKFKRQLLNKGKLVLPETHNQNKHPMNLLMMSLGVPASSATNTVSFHADGVAAFAGLIKIIESAKNQIDIAMFILSDDEVGTKILALLCARAKAGVTIRLLLDGVGSFHLPKKKLQALVDAGAEVGWFIPVLHRPLHGRTNLRNHRKMIIVDQQKVWSGGRNISADYLSFKAIEQGWVDLSFVQQGPVVATYALIFQEDWYFATGKSSVAKNPVISSEGGQSRIQIIPSGPDVKDDPIYAAMLTACYKAEESLLLVTPYYVPDTGLQEAIMLAALRGVRVDLILPEHSNHQLADIVRNRYLRVLDGAGVNIWGLPERMIHAKAMVVDDNFALSGSANLDIRSLFLNCEIESAFYSPADVRWLTGWIVGLRGQCKPLKPAKAGLFRQMFEGLASLIVYQI